MIYVFKTTVKTKTQVRQLKPHIDKVLPDVKWNFDLQDCDRILRIESEKDNTVEIIALLNTHKYHCEELE